MPINSFLHSWGHRQGRTKIDSLTGELLRKILNTDGETSEESLNTLFALSRHLAKEPSSWGTLWDLWGLNSFQVCRHSRQSPWSKTALHTSDTHLSFRPGELCVVILAPSVLQIPASLNKLMKLINIGRRPYSKGQQRFHSELNMIDPRLETWKLGWHKASTSVCTR